MFLLVERADLLSLNIQLCVRTLPSRFGPFAFLIFLLFAFLRGFCSSSSFFRLRKLLVNIDANRQGWHSFEIDTMGVLSSEVLKLA